MKTELFFRRVLWCVLGVSLGVGRVQAALEWDKQEFSIEVRRGAQEEVRTTFDFKNTGKKPVTILGVTTSCGCTTADPESSRVPAGGKSTIHTLFTLGNRTGQQEKQITIATDDPTAARVVLTLKVNIVEPAPVPSPAPVTGKPVETK